MQLNLEKLAQPIPSGDVVESQLGETDLMRLARRLNVPLSGDSNSGNDQGLDSYLASLVLPIAEPEPLQTAMEEGHVTYPVEAGGPLNPEYMEPYAHDAARIFTDPLLMTQIPEDIMPILDSSNVEEMTDEVMAADPMELEDVAIDNLGVDAMVPEELALGRKIQQLSIPLPTRETRSSNRSAAATKTRSSRGTRNSKKTAKANRDVVQAPVTTVENWAQCERCKKWRRLPATVDTDKLPDLWVCELNIWDPMYSSCDIPEETFADLSHHVKQEPVKAQTQMPPPEEVPVPAAVPSKHRETAPAPVQASLPEPEPVVVAPKKQRVSKLTLPVRPVVAAASAKPQAGRLMDHEVVELLLADNSNHPLRERLTMYSLDKASMLATELPHEVLMIGEIPLKKKFKSNESFVNGAGHYIRPDDDLLKDDPSFRDDGTVSIGIARKTQWPAPDQDASTIDSVEEYIDPGRPPASRANLAAMFPMLIKQLPKYKPLKSVRTANAPAKRESRNTHKTRSSQANEALSAMDRKDLMEVLSLFSAYQSHPERLPPGKHYQLEEKLMGSKLPLNQFLHPLSMLALPLPYFNPPPEPVNQPVTADTGSQPVAAQLKMEPQANGRHQKPGAVAAAPKRESKRRVTVKTPRQETQAAEFTDTRITNMREEYARRSVGKSYFKKLKGSHPDIDYPAPECKRLSKTIGARYSRAKQEEQQSQGAQQEDANPVAYQITNGLALCEALQSAEIPENLELHHPREFDNLCSIFGVEMSHALDLLNCPITLDNDGGNMVSHISPRQALLSGIIKKGAHAPLADRTPAVLKPLEDADVNMDVYKNPRLLTEV